MIIKPDTSLPLCLSLPSTSSSVAVRIPLLSELEGRSSGTSDGMIDCVGELSVLKRFSMVDRDSKFSPSLAKLDLHLASRPRTLKAPRPHWPASIVRVKDDHAPRVLVALR